MTEWLTWCEPAERYNPKVQKGDITKALTWFREIIGRDAGLIALHPKLQNLETAGPENIEVKFIGGCLAWEIWLSADGVTEIPRGTPQIVLKTPRMAKKAVTPAQKTYSTPVNMLQRKIIMLSEQGMTSRAIAEKLKSEGIFISHMTVARKLQGVLF